MTHPYDPQCPDCIPAIMNVETGELYGRGSPVMVAVMRVWNAAPFRQRQAFIAVTVDNSRDPIDLALCDELMPRLGEAIAIGANQ